MLLEQHEIFIRFVDIAEMNSSPDEIILKGFGNNLKRVRDSRNLSLLELAHLADLNVGNISKIELGKNNPMLTTIITLARALEVDPCELLSGI